MEKQAWKEIGLMTLDYSEETNLSVDFELEIKPPTQAKSNGRGSDKGSLSPPQQCTLRIFSYLFGLGRSDLWASPHLKLKSSLSILPRLNACASLLRTEILYAIIALAEAAIVCLVPKPTSPRTSGRTRQPHKELQPWTLTIRFPACQSTAAGQARDNPQGSAEGSTAGCREEPDLSVPQGRQKQHIWGWPHM